MKELFWNTENNIVKHRELMKQRDGYCRLCNKPMKSNHVYCSSCFKLIIKQGGEDSRVTIGQVGRNTIPYQQYLSWLFFKCNAPIQYRGDIQYRVKRFIHRDKITKAELMLTNILSASSFTYTDKKYDISDSIHRSRYLDIKDIKNVTRRLLYNILLYHLSYHEENNSEFLSEVHYQSSIIMNILINIDNVHYRCIGEGKYYKHTKYQYVSKYYYWLWDRISGVLEVV